MQRDAEKLLEDTLKGADDLLHSSTQVRGEALCGCCCCCCRWRRPPPGACCSSESWPLQQVAYCLYM